jgi:hypothetical protein
MSRARTIDSLPMFAADEDISVALMGPGKTGEWRQTAALLEPRGLPKIDAMMGGRYMPAVKRFFDNEYGLIGGPVLAIPDGPEELGACKPRRRTLRG